MQNAEKAAADAIDPLLCVKDGGLEGQWRDLGNDLVVDRGRLQGFWVNRWGFGESVRPNGERIGVMITTLAGAYRLPRSSTPLLLHINSAR